MNGKRMYASILSAFLLCLLISSCGADTPETSGQASVLAVSTVTRYFMGELHHSEEYLYDESGVCTGMNWYNGEDGRLELFVQYESDEDGSLTTVYECDPESGNDTISHTVLTYDENGNLTEKTAYWDFEDNSLYYDTNYNYDSAGRITSINALFDSGIEHVLELDWADDTHWTESSSVVGSEDRSTYDVTYRRDGLLESVVYSETAISTTIDENGCITACSYDDGSESLALTYTEVPAKTPGFRPTSDRVSGWILDWIRAI